MNRSVKIVGVLLLALTAGACGRTDVRPIDQPTYTTPTTPVPAKYVAVPTCKQIEQKVRGLPMIPPKLSPKARLKPTTTHSREITPIEMKLCNMVEMTFLSRTIPP